MLKKKLLKENYQKYFTSELRIRNGSSNELSSPICVGLSKNKKIKYYF